MKSTLFLLGAAAGSALANPGMKHLVRGLVHEGGLVRRQAPPVQNISLPGDLATIGAVTPVGVEVQTCLQDASGASCEVNTPKTYTPPGSLGSELCKKDTCCVWDSVSKDAVALFTDSDGTCNSLARAAVRLGFHDAASWSVKTGPGGADGSLVLNSDEIARSENNGLQDIRLVTLTLLAKYEAFGVGAADLVQFLHNVAVVVCPLGPRQLTFVGRDSSALVPPTGLLPDTHAPVTDLLNLFLDKQIGTIDLISLIGAHTTATQRFVDPSKAGPLDTTDGIWDVAFYSETLGASPPPGTFRLPSDNAFSLDNRTERGFTVFSDPATGQQTWNAFYSKAYLRMSLLGVNKINQLTDCTKVLPDQQPVFVPKNNTVSTSSSSASLTTKPTSTYSSSSVEYTTSTIYDTKTITITKGGHVTYTTTVVPVSTTICPVSTSIKPVKASTTAMTTSTVYATKTLTITEHGTKKYSTTVVPVSTTICPVETSSSVPVKPVYESSSTVSPVYNYPSSSKTALPVVTVTTAKPYPVASSKTSSLYAVSGTGAYYSTAAAQFTGAANKNSFGLAALAGAAAVALF